MLLLCPLAGAKRPRVEQLQLGSEETLIDDELSVVYVCELPEVKGKFDPSKAEAFFNRPGPHYGLLQAGKSVMGSDGKTMVRKQLPCAL
jgi:ribonuclease Z